MQRRWIAPDGVDEPEVPVLRGVMPIIPAPPQIRPLNPPLMRARRVVPRLRTESPDTAIEYDQNEMEALRRMKEYATSQVNGLAFIGEGRQDTSFTVVNDDVRSVREAEERYLMKEMDAHLKLIQQGNIDRASIHILMTPLCNYVERIEMELTNTKNLLTDIQARQAELVEEMEHVERISQVLEKGYRHGIHPEQH